jgi:hypothetical protein
MVEPYLRELKAGRSIDYPRDHHRQILTNDERRKLAEWLLKCADGQDPKDRSKISAKVREMLRARHASNKKKKYGAGTVRLTDTEITAAESKDELSHKFFQHFYPWCRAYGIEIDAGVSRAQDEKRAVKHTEAVVNRHFYGEFGLEAELIDAGVMDAETKVIKDPRRVINLDETPQPVDMPQKGRRKKKAKRKGQPAREAGGCNKESVTVNMAWDLSGWLYGCQLVLKRKEITDDMALDAPRGARQFDNFTDLAHMQSRYCVFSRTKDGMQTQVSFLEFLELLNEQITARSEAEVAQGKEPIQRPVVVCLDNHASRYSEDVLVAMSGQQSRLGMRMFTEEAGTSGFLQSLDQYNSKFHRHYNKGRDAYKEAYEARYNTQCAFGLLEFLKVLGGDAELGLPGVWFSWADPYDVVTAWRKVGIAGNVLKPELIDRSEFIDQPPPGAMVDTAAAAPAPTAEGSSPAAAEAVPRTPAVSRKRAADLAKTPEGMVSGSIESERAKVRRLQEYAEELEAERDAPFDPVKAGVLVPTAVTRRDRQQPAGRKRLSDLHGSVTMRGVGEEAARRNAEATAAETAAKEKRQKTEELKAAQEREMRERHEAFARCEHACTCGVVPCPWAKWKRCPTCGPKSSLCKARACVAARKPLLLGYNPAVEGQEVAEGAQ